MTSRRTHGPPEDLLDDRGQLRVPVVLPPDRDTRRASKRPGLRKENGQARADAPSSTHAQLAATEAGPRGPLRWNVGRRSASIDGRRCARKRGHRLLDRLVGPIHVLVALAEPLKRARSATLLVAWLSRFGGKATAQGDGVIIGRRHLERVLRTYIQHYNSERPHSAIALTARSGLEQRRATPARDG